MVVDGNRGNDRTGVSIDHCDAARGARVGYVDQLAIRTDGDSCGTESHVDRRVEHRIGARINDKY
jgi:hypothetical protein